MRKLHGIDAKNVEVIEIDTAISGIRDSSDQDHFGDEFWTPSQGEVQSFVRLANIYVHIVAMRQE